MLKPMTCKDIDCVFFLLWLLSGYTANSLPNVAPSGTATQSSTAYNGYASAAIDGNRNPYYYSGSCTHTEDGIGNWWSLLLPAVYRITSINITNRNECADRIDNAEILIGNSLDNNGNNNPRCAVISSIPSGGTSGFDCRGMIGRLVNVFLPVDNPLTICELEVYGELAAPSPSFKAVVNGRNIVLVERKLCWSDALFYCRDFYWDLFSIRSEEEQTEVEEVLRNASFPVSAHVWLGLRRYLLTDIWFWMLGESVNYTNWRTKSVWQNTSPCGGLDTRDSFFWMDLPCGVHLYFICLTDVQRDTQKVDFVSSTRP